MIIIQIIICFLVILSSGYGLIYNKIRNIKENKNSMWIYYTNLSNLVILIYCFLLVILLFNNNFILNILITNSIIQYSIMMTITITMLIYHFILRKNMKEKEENSIFFKIQNKCLHYITPILVIIYWIIGSSKLEITKISCLYWMILLLIYLLGILIRAKFISENTEKKKYPYHFLDIDAIGRKKFYINVFLILFTFILISEIIYMLIKVIYM